MLGAINYIAILGHNLADAYANIRIAFSYTRPATDGSLIPEEYLIGEDITCSSIINYPFSDMAEEPTANSEFKNGTTIIDLSSLYTTDESFGNNSKFLIGDPDIFAAEAPYIKFYIYPTHSSENFQQNITIGAISYGTYIDMPYAPNLEITSSLEFDGIRNRKTLGGSTSTNTLYAGSPDWPVNIQGVESMKPFSCQRSFEYSQKVGRRIWDIEYSSLFDYEIQSPVLDSKYSFASKDLYTQFVAKTLGGQLPFIFELNKDDIYTATDESTYDNDADNTGWANGDFVKEGDHRADNFCIARLGDDTLEMDRIAPRIYELAFTIEESW